MKKDQAIREREKAQALWGHEKTKDIKIVTDMDTIYNSTLDMVLLEISFYRFNTVNDLKAVANLVGDPQTVRSKNGVVAITYIPKEKY